MKPIRMLGSALLGTALLAGCQTVPDLSDTTNATLRFRLHFDTPGLTTPHVEIKTNMSTLANRCVFVNEPFGIVANVADPQGVRSIIIGPSAFPFDAVKARFQPGDVSAIPGPAEPTVGSGPDTEANPGGPANGAIVRVKYSTAKAFDTVTLQSVYVFNGATRAAMRATASNWGQKTGVAEVFHFFVEKAVASDPARQPGMPCAVPPG